jgi:tetratricopeptide (TPR) repeat protein
MFLRFFIACFSVAEIFFSQTLFDSLIVKGIEEQNKFNFTSADSIFNKAINLQPENPAPYHFIAQKYLWFSLGDKKLSELKVFFRFSEIALQKGEEFLDKNSNNAEALFLLGLIEMNRAIANSSKDEMLDAFWASKSAVGYFEDAIEIDSSFADAYFGLGLLEYFLSYVPSVFKWSISLVGLTADKELGLRHLQKAFKNGKLMKDEAGFHLAKMLIDYTADFNKAAEILETLTVKYPANPLFHYRRAIALVRATRLDEAEKELDTVIKLNAEHFSHTTSLAYFLKGTVYFYKNDFSSAVKYFNLFFEKTPSIDFTGIANFRAAISEAMLGNNKEAKRYLLLAANGNEDIQEDDFAKRKSELYFDDWLSEEHKTIVLAVNFMHQGKFEKTIEKLAPIIDDFSNDDFKLAGYCYLAQSYLKIGKIKEAAIILQKAENVEPNNEPWLLVYKNIVIAQYYIFNDDYSKAENYLEKAEDLNDGDFKNNFEALIVNLKSRIKK